MLDNEQQPNDALVDPSLPKPPAGRRSRRRPAGPPEPEVVAPTPDVVEQPTPDLDAEDLTPPEAAPAPEPDESGPVGVDTDETESGETESGASEIVGTDEAEADQLDEIEAAAEHADTEAAAQPDDDAEEAPSGRTGSDGDQSEQSEGASRRRRRRRGGRRRHSASDEMDQDEADDEGSDADTAGAPTGDSRRTGRPGAAPAADAPVRVEAEADTDDSEDEDDEEGPESGSSGASRRRRRRRRRRGEDASTGSEDDPTEVVVKVRDTPAASDDKIHGVEGSTRLEAKRQRRREGRAAGRRRAPLVSESEFLTRRESVNRQMVLRQSDELSQIAVLEDGVLVEHYVDRESSSALIGNIYLGRVQNVLPSMEAAFIDIGRGRNAVLYAGEVDWDAHGSAHSDRRIENVLKSGQQILVQVTKDPVGAKGARLTNHVSIPGRYVVYAPGGHLSGITRKLPDVERKRLKQILAELIEESASVIVRTAAEGATREQLVHDVSRLKSQWEGIEKKAKQGGAPQLLYSEPDLTIRTVRDLFTEDFAELVIDGHGGEGDAYEALTDYLQDVAPHLSERIVYWDRQAKGDVFSHYRLDEQIAKALERKVHLPSGGSLIIDRTEAMTVVDVNTGKFTGHGGNLESTVTANNLEAAEELVRQLRLRDIGGIIVVDFIDMVLPSNRELLLRRMIECLGRDRTRHQVSEVTSLGLVQMTRKKIGTGLAEAFTEPCEHCNQRGYLVHDMPVATQAPADGGDRQGRNTRKRSKGRNGGPSVPAQTVASGSGNGQPQDRPDADQEHLSEEARAAAQAAISAVAHAGAKPRTEAEADTSTMLDDLVAALQDDGSATDAPTSQADGQAPDETSDEQPDAAPARSRRSGRTRSRRSASTPPTTIETDAAVPEDAPAGISDETPSQPESEAPTEATEPASEPAPARRARSSSRKTAAKRSSTRKSAATAPEATSGDTPFEEPATEAVRSEEPATEVVESEEPATEALPIEVAESGEEADQPSFPDVVEGSDDDVAVTTVEEPAVEESVVDEQAVDEPTLDEVSDSAEAPEEPAETTGEVSPETPEQESPTEEAENSSV